MSLIYLSFHMILSHDQIVFESRENGEMKYKSFFNLPNLRDP
jgi:hypothetical protein